MNLADLVHDAAEDHPAKPALIFGGSTLTYLDLDRLVDLTASALARFGVRKGDRVALIAGNVPEFVYGLFGTLRSGGVAVPLNVMLSPDEVRYILVDAGARVAIVELPYVPGLLEVRDHIPSLETIVTIGGPPAPGGTVSLEEALTEDEEEPPPAATAVEDPAVICYTAGTTAAPKGAVLTHGNLAANLDQLSSVPLLGQTEEDVVLAALPLFHIYGLNAVLGMTVKSGATAVLVERFRPKETLELIPKHGITVLVGAPPMYAAWLLTAEAGTPADLSSVRLAVSGAAALPGDIMQAFTDRFDVVVWEGYGLTEAAPAVASNAAGDQAKPNSIGKPIPGVEVRLVDDNGEDVDEEDDPGELWVRGPNVFAGYWHRPEDTARVLHEGWLKTGDVAYRDEDGYLFIVDRKKDLIIVSGFNVFPKEVEDAIEAHPKVAEVAVVGIPDERTGEAVQAWVVPMEGEEVTEDELREFLHDHLARFKLPKEVKMVDELPRHVTGKVLRRFLRGTEDVLGGHREPGEPVNVAVETPEAAEPQSERSEA